MINENASACTLKWVVVNIFIGQIQKRAAENVCHFFKFFNFFFDFDGNFPSIQMGVSATKSQGTIPITPIIISCDLNYYEI